MTSRETSYRGPLLAALVPFALAITFLPFGVRPAAATTAATQPALAFTEYVVNMGPYPVEPRPVIGARFQFTNRSDTKIHIARLDASCGCLSPKIAKKTWAAGESGDLDLRVSTVGQAPGPHEYTLRLEYGPANTETKPTVVTLALRVVFPEQKIVVRPRSLLFYQLGTTSLEREGVVSDQRGDSLKIESIEVVSEYVTAKQVDEAILANGSKNITVKVAVAGTVPAGDTRALVNLRTNDEDFPVIQVPLMIKGPKRPNQLAIAAEPELLILASQDANAPLTGQLKLTGVRGNAVKVRSVTADPPIIQAKFESNKKAGNVTVSATVDQKHVTGFNRGMLTIETDEPDRGRIEVPIMLRVIEPARQIGPPEPK